MNAHGLVPLACGTATNTQGQEWDDVCSVFCSTKRRRRKKVLTTELARSCQERMSALPLRSWAEAIQQLWEKERCMDGIVLNCGLKKKKPGRRTSPISNLW